MQAGDEVQASKLSSQLAAARELLGEIRADELNRVRQAIGEVRADSEHSRCGRLTVNLINRYLSSSGGGFFDGALEEIVADTGSGRAALVLFSTDGTATEILATRNFVDRDAPSRTLLDTLRQSRASLRISDASSEERFSAESSVIRPSIRSVLLTPIKVRDEVVAAVYLENNRIAAAFTEEDQRLMEQIASVIGLCLEASHRISRAAGDALLPTSQYLGALAEIVGQSPKLRASLQVAAQVTDSLATVLIDGETGTGKELVALAIHQMSHRAAGPFVAVNCAAVPETLVESELFGHEKGAFTDAHERRVGRVELAAGGTLFLDEIAELSRPVQAKLLRFLQSKEFQRLGSTQTVKGDVRVIAATSRDLKKMMQEHLFLDGLYYRLNVVPISLPPLRERREDIPLLANHFLRRFAEPAGRPGLQFDRQVLLTLEEYDFPGNVRELENLVQRLVLLAEGDRITVSDLPESVVPEKRRVLSLDKNPLRRFLRDVPRDPGEMRARRAAILCVAQQYIDELEDAFVQKLLQQTGGNTREAARLSGLNRSAIYRSKQRHRVRNKQTP
jgi:transcriptional regulator with GAF, ATPase, and Fis domain